MRKHTALLLFMMFTLVATAQSVRQETDSCRMAAERRLNRQINLGYVRRTLTSPLPIAVAGAALIPLDRNVSEILVTQMPAFRTRVDDYIQYLPWATHLTLGLCGVEGCSKNRYQIFVAEAFTAAMMATTVNALKYGIGRKRPDGGKNSMPSGHTATAFAGATLLAHEFGNKSIWIPIAGYTVATATGVLRVLNNRHYVSDVLVGAAIGVLTAELSYWVTDVLFKDRKLYGKRTGAKLDIIKNY